MMRLVSALSGTRLMLRALRTRRGTGVGRVERSSVSACMGGPATCDREAPQCRHLPPRLEQPTGSTTGFVGMRFSPVTKPIPLKAVAIDALDCQQLGNASRISTTPSPLPSPRISLNSSSNSKHRNRDRPLYDSATGDAPPLTMKRLGSPYRSGRTRDWIKSKNPAVKREAEDWGKDRWR